MKDFLTSAGGSMIDIEADIDSTLSGLEKNQRTVYARLGKRVLDISIVLLTLCLTLPVIVLCATFTALDGHWPFFGHKRIGVGGREFTCWKVRSMLSDSDRRLMAHLESDPAAREEWDRTRKLKNDPRITRFGRFLRKSSLDELPQILNVLKGEMSIVGPRPVVRDELAFYGMNRQAYLAMRPGITGLWQVSGRNDVSYSDRVSLDQTYSRTFSFLRDVKIILRTVGVVLMRNGH